ncbi:AAA family ATPase [Sulfolobus sp. A20]|uniref:AAA family ATPase n=1 Tax=Saccharolobus sp. A20 TaxID=1891280 RepID=UPI000845DEEE|nr:ATP-binding protein [Sulfolobus sp. A20]AOL16714.1 AAA family ATPase [Sulfolobus sp. A20]TRM77866.1 ATP-binding protein [Sulfolobus sp. A20-N-F8]TRM89582.1 ATP-binding protein [Sulfolobus sp. C3]
MSISIGIINSNLLSLLGQIILLILFFALPIIFWAYFSRRIFVGNRSFHKERTRVYIPNVRWDEVYDLRNVKMRLEEIVKIVQEGRTYGVILFGPPGTGKTTMAKALANKLGWAYFELRPSKIMSKWYGESEFLLDSFFDQVEVSTPAVVFIDELDSLAMSRQNDLHEVTHRLVNILLMRLQDLHDKGLRVLIIGATNVPQEIDEAFLRPGRFDEIIYVSLPDENGRKEIFKGYIRREGIDYDLLAKKSERFSPADIKNVVDKVMSKKIDPTTEDFIKEIESYKPSVQLSTIIKFENIARKYERSKLIIKSYGIPEITWNDLGDLEEVKRIIKESIELPLINKEFAEKLGISPVKGILLYGPPGTGKTSIAKAIANDLKFTFIEISGEEISSIGPLEAPKVIAEKFYTALDNTPAIIFIDEIDMIARNRMTNEWRNALTELLRQMDGLREIHNVIVIGATNRPWDLDPAILRPGRFDKVIYVPPPSKEGREKIIEVLSRGLQISKDVIVKIAEITENYTPADIKLVIEEIKRNLLKEASISGKLRIEVTLQDFLEVLNKVKPSVDKQTLSLYERFAFERK